MPTIAVNDLTLCHKGSNGVAIASIPDVCKIPGPTGPIPIPFPNIARSADLSGGSKRVTADGNSVAIKGSQFAKSSGDEAGTLGGVSSGVNKGSAKLITTSFDVKVEGKPVGRLSDKMKMNKGNTACLGGLLMAPVVVSLAESAGTPVKDEEEKAWVEIELLDSLGIPVANEQYVVYDDQKKEVTRGTLDKEGKAEVRDGKLEATDRYFVHFPALWQVKESKLGK